jgi:hypothetical protein
MIAFDQKLGRANLNDYFDNSDRENVLSGDVTMTRTVATSIASTEAT